MGLIKVVNGNCLTEHMEGCENCFELEEQFERKKISEEQYHKAVNDCWTDSEATAADMAYDSEKDRQMQCPQ